MTPAETRKSSRFTQAFEQQEVYLPHQESAHRKAKRMLHVSGQHAKAVVHTHTDSLERSSKTNKQVILGHGGLQGVRVSPHNLTGCLQETFHHTANRGEHAYLKMYQLRAKPLFLQ